MLQTCKLVAALHSTLLLKFMSTQVNDMKFEDYYRIFRTCTPLVLVLFFIITLRISTVDRRLVQHAKLKKLQELNESSNAKNYHSINPRNRQIKVTVNRSMKCTNYFQQGWETTIKEMSGTDLTAKFIWHTMHPVHKHYWFTQLLQDYLLVKLIYLHFVITQSG